MTESILDGRFAFQRLQHDIAVGVCAGIDLQVGEFRNVFIQRVVELELALLIQRQQCHAGDRLGHGVQAEQAVRGHRAFGARVGVTVSLVVHDAAMPRHRHHDTGHPALVHLGLDGVIYRGKAFPGKAGLRVRAGDWRQREYDCDQHKITHVFIHECHDLPILLSVLVISPAR
jgi:hypothetical protein